MDGWNPYSVWSEMFDKMAHPPKTWDQYRRELIKTTSKEELWTWHDEIIEELKKRG